jgi:hypothetical protein
MTTARSAARRALAILAADGGLFTTAAFAVALGAGVAAGTGSHASNVAVGAGLTAAAALGPLTVWLLHGRHAGFAATLAALLGYVAGGAAVFAMLLLSGVVMRAGRAAGVFTTTEDGSSVVGHVAAALLAAALLGLCGWAGSAAVRDLLPGRREHLRLDAARLVAGSLCVAYVALVLARVATGPGANAGMNAMLMLAGPLLTGAAVVTVADLMTADDRRSTPRAGSGEPASPVAGQGGKAGRAT